jgi:hypothetical protein
MDEQGSDGSIEPGVTGPVPAPPQAPVAVVGVGGPARNGHAARIALIIVTVVVLVATALAALGYVAFIRVWLPFRQGVAISASLTDRARAEYPGSTFAGLDVVETTGTAEDPVRTRTVYVTLVDRRNGGFRFTVMYTAPSATATTAAAFENLDDFFRAEASPSQPTASFISMWTRTHAGDTCDYVSELGESSDTTRTYQVGFTSTAKGTSRPEMRDVYFSYAEAVDLWTESATDPLDDGAAASDPASEESAPDTATVVASALPMFEVVGSAQEPEGGWVTIVRNREFHKVKMVVDPQYLDAGDASDGMMSMFAGAPKRARAFAKMWTARHPGTIIESLDFDPDYTNDGTLIEVGYTPGTAADVGVWNRMDFARFRYRPASETWVRAD